MKEDFLVIFIYVCAVVILLFIRLVASYYQFAAKVYKIFAKLLLFNFLLRYLLLKYLQVSIASLINLRSLIFTSPSDSFSSVVAILMTCILVITPPFFLALLLTQKARLGQHKQQERFGTLYNDLKYHSHTVLVYNVIFVSRRLTYAVAVVTLQGYFIVQYMLLLSQSILVMSYCYLYKPFQRPLFNYMEIINELFYIVCAYHLLGFADSRVDVNVKYETGWSMIFFTIVCTFANICLLIYDSFKLLKLHCLKLKQKIDLQEKAKKVSAHDTSTSPERKNYSSLDQTNQTQQLQAFERGNIRQYQTQRNPPQPINDMIQPRAKQSMNQFQKPQKDLRRSYFTQTQPSLPYSKQPQPINNQQPTDFATSSQMNSQPARAATQKSHLSDLSELKDAPREREQQSFYPKPTRQNPGDRLKSRQAQKNLLQGAQTFRQAEPSKVLIEERDPISPFVTWKPPNVNEKGQNSSNFSEINDQISEPDRSLANQDEVMIEEELKEQPYPHYGEDILQEYMSAYQKGLNSNQY